MPSKEIPFESPSDSLQEFIKEIVGEDSLRVEEDLGQGYVRIKSSEAERRQAIQDIRCSEDIVLEMLRNARDASAKNIFLAFGREGKTRTIVIIDDGCGIPEDYHERIFQPRVTSKLDSAKLDKWGIHGRGMALYSIATNASYSQVQSSKPGLGAAIKVMTDTDSLPERADQSTFPLFEETSSGYAMRGPKNILRTAAEFAFEHRDSIRVYCGTDTEIVASLYEHGIHEIPASQRLFSNSEEGVDLTQVVALSQDEKELANRASELGISISPRSARRILDGDIAAIPTLMKRLETESFPGRCGGSNEPADAMTGGPRRSPLTTSGNSPRISRTDLDDLEHDLKAPISSLAEKYYIEAGQPIARQRGSKLIVEFDLIEKNS